MKLSGDFAPSCGKGFKCDARIVQEYSRCHQQHLPPPEQCRFWDVGGGGDSSRSGGNSTPPQVTRQFRCGVRTHACSVGGRTRWRPKLIPRQKQRPSSEGGGGFQKPSDVTLGWDDSKEYRDLISGKASKLCKRCITAKATGEYRYPCEGCAAQVTGSFEDVRDLLNVVGKAFCKACISASASRKGAIGLP